MNLGPLYLDDSPSRIAISEDVRDTVREQLRDNKGAQYAQIQAISLQIISHSVDVRDFLSLFCELQVPTSAVTDNFNVTSQEWMAMRSADPTSIVSCLECRTHLPDSSRRTFLSQLRTLKYLGQLDVGDLVEFSKICELLCDTCSRAQRRRYEAQARAERLRLKARKAQLCRMPLTEYLKTPEWRALRQRVLNQAGNRCQVCGKRNVPLDVHHNSYERFGDELLEDLVCLCRECHEKYHKGQSEAA